MVTKLEIKDWLELNAKLQQKKNALRKVLSEKGILKREGNNTYDKYKYFSEAQYKELFTALFSSVGLELTSNEVAYNHFDGTDKMPFGVNVTWEFTLTDIETGFYEKSIITGEGLDKGDKAGYKANTGAIKYYLANTFMVATGDDPETESPDGNKKTTYKPQNQQSTQQIDYRQQLVDYCNKNGLDLNLISSNYNLKRGAAQEEYKRVYDELVKGAK